MAERITFDEFLEWISFLEQEEVRTTKGDLYLAQIAAEVRRSYVTNPREISVEHFILGSVKKESTEAPEERIQKSKSAWLSIMPAEKK